MSKTQTKNAKIKKSQKGKTKRTKALDLERRELPKGGRPITYDANYHPQWARRYAMLRFTHAEIANCFGITEVTLYQWKQRFEELSYAIREGMDEADGMVASKLFERAIGAKTTKQVAIKVKTGQHTEKVEVVELTEEEPPETKAAMFWLNNRNSKKWKDKSTVEVEGSDDLMQIMAEARARAHKAQEGGE